MITAATIGLVARDWLQMDRQARVMGVTSRGVFLLLEPWDSGVSVAESKSPLPSPHFRHQVSDLTAPPGENGGKPEGRGVVSPMPHIMGDGGVLLPSPPGGGAGGEVVFLSTEKHPGPLTVNIPDTGGWLGKFERQTPLQITGQSIHTFDYWVNIDTRHAKTWLPPLRPRQILSVEERMQGVEGVMRQLFPGQVNASAGWPTHLPGMRDGVDVEGHNLDEARLALAGGDVERLAGALAPLLGYGPGLTPGGDDVILGMLLAINRWGDMLAPGVDAGALNTILVAEAFRRTTSLSANLVACAAAGQADARLIAGLDGLVCGFSDFDTLCENFSSWGSSSGTNALLGMAMVLQVQDW